MISITNTVTIWGQQIAINALVQANETALAVDIQVIERQRDDYKKLWDLHRRVEALEGQDQRIMAHIRWFVMRRSGTDELRKMEAAIERLEERNIEGD